MNALFFFTDGGTGGLSSMIPMLLIIVAMVAMLWFTSRSNKKQEKQAQNMRDSLQVGDEITTIGGIIGKVVSIKEETLVLETSHDRTRIRILKTAVSHVDVKAEDAQD
jgi:preprotein translocase subunit YajC